MKTFYIIKYRNVTVKPFFIIIIILISLIFYCNPVYAINDSIYYKNPDKYITERVLEGKIVMLADAAHHYYDVYNTLLKVLNTIIEEAQTASAKLTLILEMSSDDAAALENYVTAGTLEKLIERLSPNMYYEDMEFYSNLRKFYLKSVERSKINIDILGFEPMDSVPNAEIIKATHRQIDSTFMVRDSILSLRIIRYIEDNPDSKILIFYGGGHLMKGLTSKPAVYGTCGECTGYFLADYLKRKYGEQKVITFDQKWLNPEYFRGTNLSDAEFNDIVVPSGSIDTSKIAYTDRYDNFVLWHNTFDYSLPIRFDLVFSRKSAEKYHEILRTFDSTGQNENSLVYNNSILYFFNLITCNDFKSPVEAAEWNGLGDYLGINIMRSDCFKKRVYELYAHSKSKKLLLMLGFKPGDIEISDTNDTLKRFDEIWNSNLEQIIFLNQIGVMWIGYPDEKKFAKDYLARFSGKVYEEPADYLVWYRKNKDR